MHQKTLILINQTGFILFYENAFLYRLRSNTSTWTISVFYLCNKYLITQSIKYAGTRQSHKIKIIISHAAFEAYLLDKILPE